MILKVFYVPVYWHSVGVGWLSNNDRTMYYGFTEKLEHEATFIDLTTAISLVIQFAKI